jgi:hypothetical protein
MLSPVTVTVFDTILKAESVVTAANAIAVVLDYPSKLICILVLLSQFRNFMNRNVTALHTFFKAATVATAAHTVAAVLGCPAKWFIWVL